jgi:phosphatidylglycerophosphate synthase
MYRIIPYALSLSRIPLAVLIILFSGQLEFRRYVATVSIFVVAMATDGLDGYLARRWGTYSQVGYVLDGMGDRAIHLALMLVFLVRYSFHPVFIWLIIFRDLAICGVQLVSKEWPAKTKHMRPLFLFHATTLRIWLGLFLLRDGFRVFTGADYLNTLWFRAVQMTLLMVTILVAYYGLVRSFGWLSDQNFDAS